MAIKKPRSKEDFPRIFTVANMKGGVAKTTTVASLAYAFANIGKKVCLIDLDFQGNLSTAFGIQDTALSGNYTTATALQEGKTIPEISIQTRNPKIDIVPSDLTLLEQMNSEQGTQQQFDVLQRLIGRKGKNVYDIFLVDTHPTVDATILSALNFTDYVLIPITPDKNAFKGFDYLAKQMNMVQKSRNKMLSFLGFVLCRFNSKNALHNKIEERIRGRVERLGLKVFKSTIPESNAVGSANEADLVVGEHRPHLNVSKQYAALAEELLPYFSGKRVGASKRIETKTDLDSILKPFKMPANTNVSNHVQN